MHTPKDLTDVFLAPVVLALDARLAELGQLGETELAYEVALEGDRPEWNRAFREEGVLQTLGRDLDLHGWVLSWDLRGLRLSHGDHSLVLGIPPRLHAYLEGTGASAR